MTRDELILDCRYYNGEDEAPETIRVEKRMFWFYEKCWVDFVLNNDKTLQESMDYFCGVYHLDEMLPEEVDGTPLSLKAILFNRYDHWCGRYGQSHKDYGEQMKEWYLHNYVAGTKTHRQLLDGR